jgi:hypothetical protein
MIITICHHLPSAHGREVRDLADLRQRIIGAVELITRHMLINTSQDFENRLDICQPQQGPTLKCMDVHKNILSYSIQC